MTSSSQETVRELARLLLKSPFLQRDAERDEAAHAFAEWLAARGVSLGAASEAPPDWIDEVIQAVAELPDRTSPDDWPEAMLVTGDELRDILAARGVRPSSDPLVVLGRAFAAACDNVQRFDTVKLVATPVIYQAIQDARAALEALPCGGEPK